MCSSPCFPYRNNSMRFCSTAQNFSCSLPTPSVIHKTMVIHMQGEHFCKCNYEILGSNMVFFGIHLSQIHLRLAWQVVVHLGYQHLPVHQVKIGWRKQDMLVLWLTTKSRFLCFSLCVFRTLFDVPLTLSPRWGWRMR